MQESALGSVFIFRGRSIGLDNYKSKESLSRVVVKQMLLQDLDMMQMEIMVNYIKNTGLLIYI